MKDTQMLLIMGVVFLVFLLVMGGLIFFLLKRSAVMNEDTSVSTSNDSAQSFLPFKDIKDSMVDLGNYEYRAFI